MSGSCICPLGLPLGILGRLLCGKGREGRRKENGNCIFAFLNEKKRGDFETGTENETWENKFPGFFCFHLEEGRKKLSKGEGKGGKPKGNVLRKTTYLHLNIQHAHLPLLRHIPDSLHAGPVIVPPELGVLEKTILGHEPQELVPSCEIVLASVDLAGAGGPSRVCIGALTPPRSALYVYIHMWM